MRHTRVIVTHYGGPDALRVVEEECPEPKDGEVRVRVLAAGVSLPDLMMREGVHPETPRLPFTPGWDLIGVVDRLGAGISGIEPGQIVAALPISGAYAEFVCLPQRELVPVPPGLDAAEAVSLVLNYVTAYQMLHRSAKVRSGQRVLIHGAAVVRESRRPRTRGRPGQSGDFVCVWTGCSAGLQDGCVLVTSVRKSRK